MTELYALPDHEVVEDLLPGIAERHLDGDAAAARLKACPGLVPVAIRPTGGVGQGEVYFADIGDAPFREWQFMYTLRQCAADGRVAESFTSDLTVLLRDDLPDDTLDPAGLIFHVSRCGSTLMAKALARVDAHVVINQGGPLQRGFWAAISDDWRQDPVATEAHLQMFRSLVRLMARRRRGVERTAFVKFISWNVMVRDFVTRAYPDTPSLFLYRDPVEVIASVFKETTAVLHAKGTRQGAFLTGLPAERTAKLSDTEYLAECYAAYYRNVLAADRESGLSIINYRQVKNSENFRDIMARGLGLRPDMAALNCMLEQFRYHSKDDRDAASFEDDSAQKRAALSAESRRVIEETCGALTARLDASAMNLFPCRAEGAAEIAAAVTNG